MKEILLNIANTKIFSCVFFCKFHWACLLALTLKSIIRLKQILVSDEVRLDVYIFPNGFPVVPAPVVGDFFFPFPTELP